MSASRNFRASGSFYGGGYGAPRNYPPSYNQGGMKKDGRRDDKSSRFNTGGPPRKRERSPNRSFARDDRKSFSSKYDVRPNTHVFEQNSVNVTALRRRFTNKLYVPSDFVKAELKYNEHFPMYDPYTLGNKCDFLVMNKEVERLDTSGASIDLLEPKDADFTYVAKVMLLSSADLSQLFNNTVKTAEQSSSEYAKKESIFKQLQFLVGKRNTRDEYMAIGGPWSPSLDGNNPDSPQTLINTAIRTCKALTGIDLTKCEKWFKFLELQYLRPADRIAKEEKKENGTTTEEDQNKQSATSEKQPPFVPVGPPKIETVIIFFPDVHNCMPDSATWSDICTSYDGVLQTKLNPPPIADDSVVEETANTKKETQDVNEMEDNGTKELPKADVNGASSGTHYSLIELSDMKVTDIRNELTARGLDSKGIKSSLIARLEVALKEEKDAEEAKSETEAERPTVEKPVVVESPKKEVVLSDREKKRLERMYSLNKEKASIVVNPHPNAKDGKFDCQVVSIQNLLQYSSDQQKEYRFEVSLFAELFQDMILRDAAFTIYKTLCVAKPLEGKNGTEGDEPAAKKANIENGSNDKSKVKRTVDIPTLFAFSVYDAGHCDYIKENDMEDIIYSLGLHLSRSQIRKLIHVGSVHKDNLYYRSLTDKEISDEQDDGLQHKKMLDDADYIMELASGNKVHLEDEQNEILNRVCCNNEKEVTITKQCTSIDGQIKELELKFNEAKKDINVVRDELNAVREVEETLRLETKDLRDALSRERDTNRNAKLTNKAYLRLMHFAKDSSDRVLSDIERQFKKENPEVKNENMECDGST